MNNELYRIKWSEFEYNQAMQIIIPDWSKIKTIWGGKYLVVDALLKYKERKIELCIPYNIFITAIRLLRVEYQSLIKQGNAVITLMRTYQKINHGITIKKVEKWIKNENDIG